jgi:hypothetical protein
MTPAIGGGGGPLVQTEEIVDQGHGWALFGRDVAELLRGFLFRLQVDLRIFELVTLNGFIRSI